MSNWYVRRSRDRFWSSEKAQGSTDKSDAYWTLYECLLTTCKLIAPFVPFLAEQMWQNLAVEAFRRPFTGESTAEESVHLCDYPTGNPAAIDEELSLRMALMREVVSLGRSARMGAKLKVRQPLSQVEVVLANDAHQAWLEEHAALICAELNVKRVQFTENAEQYITYTVLPDLKRLGPRLGKRLPALKKFLANADGGRLLGELQAKATITLPLSDGPVTLDADDVQVRLQAKQGWAAAQGHDVVVVLSTGLTPELIGEMLAREEIRVIQDKRKELNLDFTDRINIAIKTDSQELAGASGANTPYICSETLALNLVPGELPNAPNVSVFDVSIGGHLARLQIQKVEKPVNQPISFKDKLAPPTQE